MKEINALYDISDKLIKEGYDFRLINLDAITLAKESGSAKVIRIREGLPDSGYVAINILNYNAKGEMISATTIIPETMMSIIAETYKR